MCSLSHLSNTLQVASVAVAEKEEKHSHYYADGPSAEHDWIFKSERHQVSVTNLHGTFFPTILCSAISRYMYMIKKLTLKVTSEELAKVSFF